MANVATDKFVIGYNIHDKTLTLKQTAFTTLLAAKCYQFL